MKTLYAACLHRLGLSQAEAAALHGNGLDTIKKRCSGKLGVPPGIWEELRAYEAGIVDRSEAIREAWEDAGEVREIEARWDDDAGLMALADFILTTRVDPPLAVNTASPGPNRP